MKALMAVALKSLAAVVVLVSVVAARDWGWAVLLAWLALPVLWVLPQLGRWGAALVMLLAALAIFAFTLLLGGDLFVMLAGGVVLCLAWILMPKRHEA